ncbi:MAG: tetratricopeptide repeat protein [Candidatus Marinimicrobia bacterium]|nr:tetratricopeptide repeat protein [Candidatus Neomarinimicrobiota bacterium]MCF7850689.1 tetratricopeptide repeat protein [Candidatus Neomarinimicrobiota bacterium]
MRIRSHWNRPVLLFLGLLIAYPVWGQSEARKAFDTEQYDTAIEAWEEILKENPELKEIYYNQGNAQYRKGDIDEAISAYEKSLSVEDANTLADAYYNLGNAWLQKQDIDKAKDFYKRALKLRPDDLDAKANLELINHMPPPPPQDQNSQQDQDQQDQEDQEEQQNDQSQSEQDQQEQEEQQDQQQDQQNSEENEQQEQEQQGQAQQDETATDEDLMDATQLLDALKERETENMKEQIRMKTSGADLDKDW